MVHVLQILGVLAIGGVYLLLLFVRWRTNVRSVRAVHLLMGLHIVHVRTATYYVRWWVWVVWVLRRMEVLCCLV